MSAALWPAVAVIGALASCARLLIGHAAKEAGASDLGATLLLNVTGSLILGLVTGADLTGDGLVLTAGAALGSFTTFSAWIDGSRRLGDRDGSRAMYRSIALCLAAGLLAALIGRGLGSLLA